jgi:hypothetical protein
MELSKMHSEMLSQMFTDNRNKILDKYKESITTIMLGLDILEDVIDSPENKDLVQIIRHSFGKVFEIFLEDENSPVKPS